MSDLLGKSDAQKNSWRRVKNRAVTNFISVVGDRDMAEITRQDAQAFREWWARRVAPTDGTKAMHPNSTNRDIGNMRTLFKAFWEYEGERDRTNPFDGLRLTNVVYKDVPPFDTAWIRIRLLDPDALSGLNDEARAIVLTMIETGCRPSELASLGPDHIVLDCDIPHLRIRPTADRKLKSKSSERDIPLVGAALREMRKHPDGFPRYHGKANSLSATLVKYFRANGLFESPEHRIYSLRHSFEKRMLEAGLDYGLRCTLMGHHNNRPEYGDGGSLTFRRDELLKICLSESP